MRNNDIQYVRKALEEKIGEKVLLTAYGSRKKKIQKKGVIQNTYPSIFVVKIDNGSRPSTNMSFSYADIITKTVLLSFQKTH